MRDANGDPAHLLETLSPDAAGEVLAWLLENGKSKSKKVAFKDYMNPPAS